MEENLTDELDLLSDGSDAEQFPESGTWGTADGTTIVSFDPTPSPTPYPDNDDNLSAEKIDELIVALEENTKAQSEEKEIDSEEEVNSGNLEEENSDQEDQAEIVYTIDDIYERLESIESVLQGSNDTSYIHYKNSELILTFVLGFTVAFFASFILYCFIGRIK